MTSPATRVLRVNDAVPDPAAILAAADVLRRGGLVAFPTETVYGLGANALDAGAVAKIFAAKERPPTNPIIVHVADVAGAMQLVTDWPDVAQQLALAFWPGPLTLILPKRDHVPDIVTGGGPHVGVRMPRHAVARALLLACELPIAAPSANRSTRLSPTRATHVLSGLDGRIDLLLAGGPTTGGIESTVLDLTTSPPRILRPGLIGRAQLTEVIGEVQTPPSPPAPGGDSARPLPSPGLLARHYAPRAPLETVVAGEGAARIARLAEAGELLGWVTFIGAEGRRPGAPANVKVVALPRKPSEYAARLYAGLHALDDVGVARIVAELPPDEPAWEAIRDRLSRAAAGGGED